MKRGLAQYTTGDKIFYIVIFAVLTLFFIAVLYPCIFVISASFSSSMAVQSGRVVLLPVGLNLQGYKIVFNTPDVWVGLRNSFFYTVASTIYSVAMTLTAAYCLSRSDVPGRNFIMLLFTFTMFFSGGLIPYYLLIRNLRMLNTPWAIIIPGGVGIYLTIVGKTFIQHNIPGEMLDAAKIDGCGDAYYFVRIVIPLSKAIIAVMVLMYAVANWNAYFYPMIFLYDKRLFPVTIFLQQILMATQIDISTVTDPEMQMRVAEAAAVIKYALIVVTVVPVIIIYPFVQKYFIKGIMIGSVKG